MAKSREEAVDGLTSGLVSLNEEVTWRAWLVCKVRRKKRYNSYQGEQGIVAPKLLKRQFEADAPNQKWVTDVTEFSVGDRKLYLSPVMDLFDRQIISHAIGNSPNLELANSACPALWPP